MAIAYNASVTLGGVKLAAMGSIVWKFVAGVQPYATVMSVYKDKWDSLKNRMGEFLTLTISDARGHTYEIKKLTILHAAPSEAPNLVSFVVADRRWKWPYTLVVRDFNVPKKSGDRTAFFTEVPAAAGITVDVYEYRRSSLNEDGEKWTSKGAVEDVLDQVEPDEDAWEVESWPIKDGVEVAEEGQFAIQGVMMRDQGDTAIARLLTLVPGASLYVNMAGKVIVFDGADLDAAENYLKNELPFATWDGEKVEFVDRKVIRPSKVNVYYTREVEVLFEFSDDYNVTSVPPARNSPYADNVIPTTDSETEIFSYDPEVGTSVQIDTLYPGTYVPVKDWLYQMDLRKPAASFPWTFDFAREAWLVGDLMGGWGGTRLDMTEFASVAARITAFQQHFRQTFRISRRYTERIRDMRPVRVSMLDPVTGTRAPAASWGQYATTWSAKGVRLASRKNSQNATESTNVDTIQAASELGISLLKSSPSPMQITVIDKDLGVFRLDGILSPYGTEDRMYPCNLVDSNEQLASVSRDLTQQNSKPMGFGMRSSTGTNGIFLRRKMDMKACLTIIPAAPNNKFQFHKVVVEASDIAEVYQREFRIQDGDGPELDVFVPPGEVTARFAWAEDVAAKATISDLLGLNSENPNTAGIEGPDLPGYELVNGKNEIAAHSVAVAAEAIAQFADAWQGRVATRVPDDGLKLVGNMSGATISVAGAPSSKVMAMHDFPGQQKPISRLAMLPEAARHLILGVLKVGISHHQ